MTGASSETTTSTATPPLGRAVLLMTASSFLVPAAGILTQPILAQALGVTGRGQLAAAMAPHLLAVSVATLGLPDALTYYLAKSPSITRRALLWATAASFVLAVVCFVVALGALPFLSAGDPYLGKLILASTSVTLPALLVGLLRGAAVGRQMWAAVATERVINTTLRVVAFVVLLALGQLTVLAALLVSVLSPVAAGVAYWRLLLRPPPDVDTDTETNTLRQLVSYGNRVWLGSVASMLLSRMDQLLMTPMSSIEDVGLYTVATTISEVPVIVTLAISGALFGVNSKQRDVNALTFTSRLTLLLTAVGCTTLGVTLPWWLPPLFGADFDAATGPTLILLLSAVISTPGLMAAVALGAWGRPGLRSLGLLITLVVNITSLVLLVPRFGAVGACWTSIITNSVLTTFMVVTASRVVRVPGRSFLVPRRSDLARVWREATGIRSRRGAAAQTR